MACQSHNWSNKGETSCTAFATSPTLLAPLKKHKWCSLISSKKGLKTISQATHMTIANQLKSRYLGIEQEWPETPFSFYWVLHFCTFALLQARDDGNHTIPIVKGKEDCQTLQISFANVFQDINFVTNENKIASHEITVDLEFLLGVITSLFYLGWV